MPHREPLKGASSGKSAQQKTVTIDETKGEVSYTISITKNLGDYESMRVQAGITIPITADDEFLKKANELLVVARDLVETRVSEDLELTLDGLSKKKK